VSSIIIDRRKNGKNKSSSNRQRFIKRSKAVIKERVDQIVSERSIKDIGSGDKIKIPSKGIKEPSFQNGKGGKKDHVLPGNKKHIVGDEIQRPPCGGAGGREGSSDGEGEDDFVFNISREEFLEFFFEDLELPDLIKTQLKDIEVQKLKRSGFTPVGNPSNLNVLRSMKQALARKIALQAAFDDEIEKIELLIKKDPSSKELKKKLEELKDLREKVPFIDDVDLRFNSFENKPDPTTKAAMFCIMDVSASMGEYEKDLAKRFFILLYLFLQRKYEKIEIVFIRHTHSAKEVDEQEFFHSKESGGTVASTALKLAHEIIQKRYPSSDWNLYFAQASDGDNWINDSAQCEELLSETIMPLVQYYAYIQLEQDDDSFMFGTFGEKELWQSFEKMMGRFKNFKMKKINGPNEIYPVFRELFS